MIQKTQTLQQSGVDSHSSGTRLVQICPDGGAAAVMGSETVKHLFFVLLTSAT